MSLEALGVTERELKLFERYKTAGRSLGRVVSLDRGYPLVATGTANIRAEHATVLAKQKMERPTVGDWVVLNIPKGHDNAIIEAVLERRGCLARREGPRNRSTLQVLAANVDIVFIVEALTFDFNAFDLAKKAVIAFENGITPVFVLSKADEHSDAEGVANEIRSLFKNIEVVCESARTGEGLNRLRELIPAGKTAALLGRSGAGKSTMINALVGELVQKEGKVREADNAGRHTTVARNLVPLDGAGLLIDMPGLRTLILLGDSYDYGIEQLFPHIEEASWKCKFRDCTHTHEPGCAVLAARDAGTITPAELDVWLKLRKEVTS